MTTHIPETTKAYIKQAGVQFNKNPQNMRAINSGILALAKRAVGNDIKDDEPYTIRINFQNGRIVGSEAQPRLSVELLDGRAATSAIDVPHGNSDIYIEFKELVVQDRPAITNGDSWVARAKMDGDTVKTVFVNHDFSEEDQEIIKTALLRGLAPQIQM